MSSDTAAQRQWHEDACKHPNGGRLGPGLFLTQAEWASARDHSYTTAVQGALIVEFAATLKNGPVTPALGCCAGGGQGTAGEWAHRLGGRAAPPRERVTEGAGGQKACWLLLLLRPPRDAAMSRPALFFPYVCATGVGTPECKMQARIVELQRLREMCMNSGVASLVR